MKAKAGGAPIVIAGAGIAGLSAAIALTLAGFAVRVFEREEILSPVGAGIQLGPNATRILTHLDVGIADYAFQPQAIELRNARSGNLLNRIPLGETALARYGAPYVALLRSDLQQALLARAGELGCAIDFGRPVSILAADEKCVIVQAGQDTVRAEALIGADGVWSQTRNSIPSSAKPTYAQITVWRSLLPAGTLSEPSFHHSITAWLASGAHLVHYPILSGNAFNAVLALDDDWRTLGVGDAKTPLLSSLLQRLKDWAPLPTGIVAGSHDWKAWPLYYAPRSKGGEGRIQLIGDAWHAMPPFLASGGAMAIEDAASLAESFSAAPDAIAALEDFRKKRRPRIWRTASRASRMGRIYHFPRPFDIIRDAIMRAVPAGALLAANDWLYSEPR